MPTNHELFHVIRQVMNDIPAENEYLCGDIINYRDITGDAEDGWKCVVSGTEPRFIISLRCTFYKSVSRREQQFLFETFYVL